MTVPLDMGINTWIGMTFSLAAAGKPDSLDSGDSVLTGKPYLYGLGYSAVVGMGVAGICYVIAPDWMLMYYADHEEIPAAVQAGMFALYPAMYTLGFFLGRELAVRHRKLGWAAWACNLAGVLAYILASLDRLLKVGTTGEYRRGEGRSIFRSALAPILVAGIPAAFPALYYAARRAAR